MDNHFSFFGIPVSFYPDQEKIRSVYYQLSREFHPDFFGQATEAEQGEALKKSTQNTEAYKVLSSFEKRLAYVLEIKGVSTPGEKYNLSPAFLMDMMELNEEISEARENGASLDPYQEKVLNLEKELNQALKASCETFDQTGDESLLTEIKDVYYKRKYLRRLHENLDGDTDES